MVFIWKQMSPVPEDFSIWYIIRGKLIGRTVQPNSTPFVGTVPPNNIQFGGTVLLNSTLFGRRPCCNYTILLLFLFLKPLNFDSCLSPDNQI